MKSFFLANMPQCHLHFDVLFFSAVSFSTSSFLCLFCVPPRFSRALFLISATLALSTFFLSFCAVSSTSASFSTISSSAFSTSLKICIYSGGLFFISDFCSKFFAQKRISFSDRSLCHSELGILKAVQIVHCFIPNLAPCDIASFLCLEFNNKNLLMKTIVTLFSPLHVGSKRKNVNAYFVFVCVACCLS